MMHPLLTHANALRSRLQDAAVEHEAARQVSAPLAAELGREGYYRMLVPHERGGLEIAASDFVEILDALAVGDPATAWCVMTGATTGLLAAYLPEAGAAQLLEDRDVALAGVFAPMGRATPVEGGYRVTGRWPFCSGCHNARWRTGGALVMTDEGPRKTASGAPEVRAMFFKDTDSTIIDTWQVAGLCGTGSHDVAADDVFVPAQMTTCLTEDTPVSGALYRVPPFSLLALGVAAVALGIARAALDACTSQLASPRKGAKPRGADSHVQMELVTAESELRAARAFVLDTTRDVMTTAAGDDEVTLRDRALIRMAASHATTASASAVDRAYAAAGGSAIYTSNPLQRHHRDIHTVTQHIMVAPGSRRLAGRAWLSLPGDFAML